jgi:signal transduction histidine kinase
MISQILDLSKIENGNFKINSTDFDVRAVVKTAVTNIVPQCVKKSIQINTEIEKDLPYLRGDRDKIGQVVINLLGNAVKFTPSGGTITLRVKQTQESRVPDDSDAAADLFALDVDRFVRIDVADTGVGIPADKHGAIFERFFQVDNTSTREFGGTGLGLSIVKNFVDAHGGRILLESAPGQGSTFSVLLPAPP